MQPDISNQRLVFISHSSKDTWVAKQIARAVSDCGAAVFLDEADIAVGDDFEEKIVAALEQADELLVLLTPWALDRPYIWVELGGALMRKLPIIVVLHGMTVTDFQSRAAIPVFLKKRHLLEINDIDRYFQQLKARVAAGATGNKGVKP